MGCSLTSSQVCFDDFCYDVEIAESIDEQKMGLMFRETLDLDSGMLFVYETSSVKRFWMKNTKIPLDLFFVNKNGTIVDIKKNFEPCTSFICPSYHSKAPAKYVIEVNAGFADEHGIKPGHTVKLGEHVEATRDLVSVD